MQLYTIIAMLIFNAADVRETAIDVASQKYQGQINAINSEINAAAKNGEFAVLVTPILPVELWRLFTKKGYMVENVSDTHTSISW